MHNIKIINILFIFLIAFSVNAQEQLTFDAFLNLVRKNHPTARQAELLANEAIAQQMAARGVFDPKISAEFGEKQFDSKRYFQTGEYGIKVPTWIGAEVKGVYKTASGDFLNPEEKLPKIGQGVIGISMPLLQGLLIDERRGNIFKAKILQNQNTNERKALMNNLIFEASKAYCEWLFAAQQVSINEKAVALAKIRLNGLKESYRLGDKPAVDTLEAFIQLQERLFDLNEANLLLQNERLQLNNFLFNEKQQAAAYTKNISPQLFSISENQNLTANNVNNLVENHPDFLQYQFKINQLDIDRRVKQDKLKPKFNVEYNLLGSGVNFVGDALLQNYRYGVTFSFPILLRQERGNLQLTQIKLNTTELQRQQKRQELETKINNYLNENTTNRQQLVLFQSILKNYGALLDAENQKFNIGESSVFLVNSRERKLIETQIKVLKLEINQLKLYYSMLWATGSLE